MITDPEITEITEIAATSEETITETTVRRKILATEIIISLPEEMTDHRKLHLAEAVFLIRTMTEISVLWVMAECSKRRVKILRMS